MFDPVQTVSAFIRRIQTIGFFERLFRWKNISKELVDTASALTEITSRIQYSESDKNRLQQELGDCRKDLQMAMSENSRLLGQEKTQAMLLAEKEHHLSGLAKKLAMAEAGLKHMEKQVEDLKTDWQLLKQQHENVQQELQKITEENIRLKQDEEGRRQEHAKSMNTFEKWRTEIQLERERELNERHQAEMDRLRQLKQTWNEHEALVRTTMKSLCQKHTIEYAGNVPFRGSPDNAVILCNEYVVFDAKSPASDNHTNFAAYLKDQAEKAKKYARQDGVKKDIFFVVPSNTLEQIKQTFFGMGDYEVYIVSIDVLEPLLLCLQKIENYEFAEQLTPDERENICRIIGRFAHLTKRRIQIDSFFAKQFIEIIYKCESSLPEEIKNEVAAFERAEKLNPPGDRRTKSIDSRSLEKDVHQLEVEIVSKGIAVDDLSEGLNRLKLYREE